jgi:hypothetical protein
MQIIDKKTGVTQLKTNHLTYFETMIKAVVDIQKGIMAVDADMHADLETFLLESGSIQENLWGVNLYPFKSGEEFIEYTSLINIRPHQDNLSMEISDPGTKKTVTEIVNRLVDHDS